MGQQVHPKQGHEVRERPREPGLQLQVAQDQHGDQGRPDLHFHRVGAGAHQGLDREILLEGLEEQFDLPAVFVDLGNGGGPERELIGQKDQDLFCLGARALHRDGVGTLRTRRQGFKSIQAATAVRLKPIPCREVINPLFWNTSIDVLFGYENSRIEYAHETNTVSQREVLKGSAG